MILKAAAGFAEVTEQVRCTWGTMWTVQRHFGSIRKTGLR